MRLEIYVARASPVHALHPATKLALLVVGIVAPFLTLRIGPQVGAVIAALAVAAAGGVLRKVLAPWKLIALIFVLSTVIWGLTGRAGWVENWVAAASYGFRVTAIFLFGLAFLATTRIEETIHALGTFRVPYRLAFTLGLAFRLVPLFLGSAASILDAQRSRGLDLERGSVLERLKKYVPVLIPVFMTSLKNADQMAIALDARGFSAGERRTRYRTYAFGARDAAALALGAAYFAAFFAVRSGMLTSVPTS